MGIVWLLFYNLLCLLRSFLNIIVNSWLNFRRWRSWLWWSWFRWWRSWLWWSRVWFLNLFFRLYFKSAFSFSRLLWFICNFLSRLWNLFLRNLWFGLFLFRWLFCCLSSSSRSRSHSWKQKIIHIFFEGSLVSVSFKAYNLNAKYLSFLIYEYNLRHHQILVLSEYSSLNRIL